MPPKGKGKGKGKQKPQGVIIDGVNTAEMTREQIEVFALRLKEELEREREERNYFQLERDKLRTFWEITRNELDEARARIRNKERDIEVATEHNDSEIKNFRQKIKHLQYEHENDVSELKAESMMSLKQAQDEHTQQENELLRDKKELKWKLREQASSNNDEVQALKLQQSEEIYKARQHFEQLAIETEMKYEKMYEVLRKELKTKHSMEMTEVEERKNSQISNLIEDHNKAFSDVKNYYNDITLNNLALISTLKDQMEELTKQNERMVKQVNDIMAENKKLIEPLKLAQIETTELKRQLASYTKDKQTLANLKLKYNEMCRSYEDLQWVHNALELRFEKLNAERNELQKKFVEGILETQQKTGTKNMLLQMKIGVLKEKVESRDATLGELVAATQLQPHTVNKKLDELLKRKNNTIKDLQYELARISKAHDDMLQTYESKLASFGIPMAELGFKPLKRVPSGQSGMAKGPAGLIAR